MESLVVFILAAIILWLLILTYYLHKFWAHFQRLIEVGKGGSLKDILNKILDNQELDRKSIKDLETKLNDLGKEVIHHVQKVGLVRFNPFSDTGGDQSFVLALLDGTDTGIVLTSLHNRGITRWYAKSVKEGKGSTHELSEEEQKAIKQAEIFLKEKKKLKD